MEPIPSETENLLNEIETLFRWHPEKNNLSNFVHEHRMTFLHDGKTKEMIHCFACDLPIYGAMYCCDECKKSLHKSCAEFPKEINPSFHPLHPHSLQRVPDLDADVNKRKCSACDLPIRDITAYGCQSCEIYFHKFCMELPEKIKHFRHPSHRLSLNSDYIGSSSRENFRCKGCLKDHRGLNYNCESCNFNLGLQCLAKEATKPKENQGHVLTLLIKESWEEPHLREECIACGKKIGSIEVVFRCLQCGFSLHPKCVLTRWVLPSTVDLKEHRHSLKLKVSSKKRLGHFFAWRKPADERIFGNSTPPFYACDQKGCYYKVDVISALQKSNFSFAHKLDYVVLDTSPVVIKTLTVSEMIKSIPDEDKKKLSDAIKATTAEKVPESAGNKSQNERDDNQENNGTSPEHSSLSNDEPFDQILARFESRCRGQNRLTYYETQVKITTVDDKFLISENLAPVLKELLSTYRDFSQKSTLCPKGKAFVFMVLCAALYSICTTKEAEVSEGQLVTSWDCFQIARNVGFEVEFALERLRKATHAYFSLQHANASTDPPHLSQLDQRMAALSQEMETLQAKCAEPLTSVISDPILESKSIEIVGDIEVPSSWQKIWSSFELRKLLVRLQAVYACPKPPENYFDQPPMRIDSSNQVINITSFVDNHSPRPLSYFANKYYKNRVGCSILNEIVEDPTHGYISELPGKILCDFHGHTLGLYKDKSTTNKEKIECDACGLTISYPAYGCARCNFFLHKFCVQLPTKADDRRIHPHSLSLQVDSKRLHKLTCNACGEKCRGWGFSCEKCKFNLEIKCLASWPNTVESQSHGELLLYSEKRDTCSVHGCFACGRKISRPPFLRCAACNVSLHVQCAKLPPTKKFELHAHTLTLTFTNHRKAEGSLDSFRCLVCSETENPLLPIYYCEECKVFFHVDCVKH